MHTKFVLNDRGRMKLDLVVFLYLFLFFAILKIQSREWVIKYQYQIQLVVSINDKKKKVLWNWWKNRRVKNKHMKHFREIRRRQHFSIKTNWFRLLRTLLMFSSYYLQIISYIFTFFCIFHAWLFFICTHRTSFGLYAKPVEEVKYFKLKVLLNLHKAKSTFFINLSAWML